jgi:hypothetical protein
MALSRLDDLRAAHVHSLTISPDNDIYSYRRFPLIYNLPEQVHPKVDKTLEASCEFEMSLISALKRVSSMHQF